MYNIATLVLSLTTCSQVMRWVILQLF